MQNFADRLTAAIANKNNPSVIGLDPRIEQMPCFVLEAAQKEATNDDAAYRAITLFHEVVIEAIAPFAPAVKVQAAFYEQFPLGGTRALLDTIRIAKERGLLVIMDAKRNDISSTAEAYAAAHLGGTTLFGRKVTGFDADCLTVSPYLGGDSLEPFVDVCAELGKGLFVLVKTSNKGSADIQDLQVQREGQTMPVYMAVAELVQKAGERVMGESGYSAIGAVVGATHPREAEILRDAMPGTYFLVPGYGAQGGTAQDAALCFDTTGRGALVNASRGITYNLPSPHISREELTQLIQDRTKAMGEDLSNALGASRNDATAQR